MSAMNLKRESRKTKQNYDKSKIKFKKNDVIAVCLIIMMSHQQLHLHGLILTTRFSSEPLFGIIKHFAVF